MPISVVTAPSEKPVTLEKAKEHLRVTHTFDDIYINTLISAVTNFSQNWLGRRFITQTLKYYADHFPCDERYLELPVAPVQSITHVKYYDENNTQQNYTTYQTDLISTPCKVLLGTDETLFPTTMKYKPNTVEVQFVAGYGTASSVPEEIRQGLMLAIAHLYENRQDVYLSALQPHDMPRSSDYLLAPYRVFFT